MFFQNIHRMIGQDPDLILTIRKTDNDTLTVAAHMTMKGLQDEARHFIAPFTASGTPQELDKEFIPAMSEPATRSQGLLMNMKHYERQLEIAQANSKAEKERKDKETRELRERQQKSDKYRKKAEEQIAAGKLSEAMTNLRQARLYASEAGKKTLDEQIGSLRARMSQGSLFTMTTGTSSSARPITIAHPCGEDCDTDDGEEKSDDDPYGEIVDFPEECRAKDPCQNMNSQTLF